MKTFEGLGVALITPFDKNLTIDFTALEAVLEHIYASNAVNFIVVLGSTGEASTLGATEKQEILTFVTKANNNRLPLVFGHSGSDTQALIQSLYTIDITGYSAILSASPAYVKPTQEGIIAHYHTLADNSPLPIILYNVPSRTGSNIEAKSTIILAKHEKIIGIKEASGDVEQLKNIDEGTSRDFLLLSGDDMLTVPLCEAGAVGLISVMANAYPSIFKDILNNVASKNYDEATKINNNLIGLDELMYVEGNPTGIKQLLYEIGLCKPYVRLPLLRASPNLSKKISERLI